MERSLKKSLLAAQNIFSTIQSSPHCKRTPKRYFIPILSMRVKRGRYLHELELKCAPHNRMTAALQHCITWRSELLFQSFGDLTENH